MLMQSSTFFALVLNKYMLVWKNIVGFLCIEIIGHCSMETLWWYVLNSCHATGNLWRTFIETLMYISCHNCISLIFHDHKGMSDSTLTLWIFVSLYSNILSMEKKSPSLGRYYGDKAYFRKAGHACSINKK